MEEKKYKNGFSNPEVARLAGQKSKRGITERMSVLRDLFDPEKAKRVFLKLESQALKGDMKAIELYMHYVFGKPKETIDLNARIEEVKPPSWFVSQDHIMITRPAQSES